MTGAVLAWGQGADDGSEAGGPLVEVMVSGAAAQAVREQVPTLVSDQVASRLFAHDPTLWGADAEPEAAMRLAWVGLARTSRPLVGEIRALAEELRAAGLDHVVLAGMGGSSLAPEVICATAGQPLTVLDSSDPDTVRAALAEQLERTVLVVSSKSGSTLETDSQLRTYTQAFRDAGLDPAHRIVVVTDPGSALEETARAAGHRVVLADPQVGGRYSALTAFGLVPSGLAGVDVEALLDEAETVTDLLADDGEDNPGLVLGAALAGVRNAGTARTRDKVVLIADGTPIRGFADWAEQLIAESTGKQGTGLLPVVVEGPQAPELTFTAEDLLAVHVVAIADDQLEVPDSATEGADADSGDVTAVRVGGSLGAQLLLWEVATAVAGRLLSIDPFDQPDVESAKKAARGLLDEESHQPPDLVDGDIEIRASAGLLDGVSDLAGAVTALLDRLDPERGYLAVMAYLDRSTQSPLTAVRPALARRTHRPTTFGWGPRFLHSTGQYHKGGPGTGVYLQITGAPVQDLQVPGQPFSYGSLIAAQAAGDAQVLVDHDRPVLRLHLRERGAGVQRLLEVLQ